MFFSTRIPIEENFHLLSNARLRRIQKLTACWKVIIVARNCKVRIVSIKTTHQGENVSFMMMQSSESNYYTIQSNAISCPQSNEFFTSGSPQWKHDQRTAVGWAKWINTTWGHEWVDWVEIDRTSESEANNHMKTTFHGQLASVLIFPPWVVHFSCTRLPAGCLRSIAVTVVFGYWVLQRHFSDAYKHGFLCGSARW